MDKLAFEDFFSRNKFILIIIAAVIVLGPGGFFGYRYYTGKINASANAKLWKGVRLLMAFNGKNPQVITDSITYLKEVKSSYGSTGAAKISNFYLGFDYMRIGRADDADKYFKEYIKSYPKPDQDNLTYLAYSNLAAIALATKDYEGAINDYQSMSAVDGVKLREFALLSEAAVYSQIKKPSMAVSIYKKMLATENLGGDRGYIENLIQLNSR